MPGCTAPAITVTRVPRWRSSHGLTVGLVQVAGGVAGEGVVRVGGGEGVGARHGHHAAGGRPGVQLVAGGEHRACGGQ